MIKRWIAIYLLGFVACSAADTLHFKSGRTMQVVVTKETSKQITFQMGVSVFTLSKDQISKIEYDELANKKLEDQWKRKHFSNELYAPEELKPLLLHYRQLQAKRHKMIAEDQRLTALEKKARRAEKKIDPLENRILKLRAELRDRQSKMSQVNRLQDETVHKMNRLIRKAREVRGDLLDELLKQHAKLDQKKRILSVAATNAAAEYQKAHKAHDEAVVEFKEARALIKKVDTELLAFQSKVRPYRKQVNHFQDQLNEYDSVRGNKEYTHIFGGIDQTLQTMRTELRAETVPVSRRRNTLMVDVFINGKVPARMIFDTGASSITLSRALADRLNVQAEGSVEQTVYLADGSRVSATPVILDSVKVGTAVRKNVEACILEQPPSAGVDGLLGMSFLKYFTVQFSPGQDSIELIHFDAAQP